MSLPSRTSCASVIAKKSAAADEGELAGERTAQQATASGEAHSRAGAAT